MRTRADLLLRFGGKCAFCQASLLGRTSEFEHFVPQSAQGDDGANNISIACRRCNANKSDKRDSRDPVTGLVVPLFNPLTDKWDDHFSLRNGVPIGKTVTGRATAALLFANRPSELLDPGNWLGRDGSSQAVCVACVPIVAEIWASNGESAETELRALESVAAQATSSELTAIYEFGLWARGTLAVKRGTLEDVIAWRAQSRNLLAAHRWPPQHDMVRHLHECYAACCEHLGTYWTPVKPILAMQMFDAAASGYFRLARDFGWRDPAFAVRGERCAQLSRGTWGEDVKCVSWDELWERGFSVVVETMRQRGPVQLQDRDTSGRLLEMVEGWMQHSGYGQGGDIIHAVLLRTEEWVLRFACETSPDLTLFQWDIDEWRRKSLFHELRVLYNRLTLLKPTPALKAAVAYVQKALGRHAPRRLPGNLNRDECWERGDFRLFLSSSSNEIDQFEARQESVPLAFLGYE